MDKKLFLLACFFGATAVALGALGSHALEKILTESKLHTFEIGVRYQFYHAVALLVVSSLVARLPGSWARRAGWCFVAGVLLFSGSLYFLAMSEVWGLNSLRAVAGPLTPIGGVFFIAGWVMLLVAGWQMPRTNEH